MPQETADPPLASSHEAGQISQPPPTPVLPDQPPSKDLHSIASDDDTKTPVFPQSNTDAPVSQVRLELGMEFETLNQFRKAIRKFNIHIGRSIFFARCDSTRSKAICYDEDCPCRNNHCMSADRKWIIDELEERIRVQPNLTVREADQYFRAEYDVLINERKIYRSMKKAKERIEGSEIAQYARLHDYGNEILKINPGSTRYYGGQLLTAIGQDANNHIYPIAYAIVESENKESWKWFLEILQEDVGDFQANGFNFLSDMQKGLIPTVQEMYPNANHMFCAMHIWQNFCKKWSDL
nr:uncharacterized protein LOC112762976 [Arachis hypogaea]